MLFVIIYVYWGQTRFPYQMMLVSFNSNTTGVAHGARTASGAYEFTPMFSWIRGARSLVFYVMFCRSFFVLCLLVIVLSVLLRFTASDYPFGIFKLILDIIVWLQWVPSVFVR